MLMPPNLYEALAQITSLCLRVYPNVGLRVLYPLLFKT